ncbi:acyl-CoA dehydrogenase [Pseudomaricurvus alkylphenolicus]|uniref:acyl-CoA dehydrogenase n=1 Tax=Pseudomaricurvus alkylphenolicus TaxID=1306991 RepID=UPI00141F27DF|nr:acyl-CoA dehydrogenase [Pseudomaricurvus alkylphenolicus]NIB43462.1 acyl-CoA dehydrogenase [Pseudomaricurvus alkylphenolicus]
MNEYTPPLEDIKFVIDGLHDYSAITELPPFQEYSKDIVDAVLEEGGRMLSQVLAPLNRAGDIEGLRLKESSVTMPKGFSEAYSQLVEGGWLSVGFPTELGGQGFPTAVALGLTEMMQSANLAFSMCPTLSVGAVHTLHKFAHEAISSVYVPKLVSGEWTATMALTEPQAGSDLSLIKTKAVRKNDHYLLKGQKIFISFGDHDMAENIAHLVLARLDGAPEGVKGISLFVVPKYLPSPEGEYKVLNDVKVISIEHKLGLHASPTCTLNFGDEDGAVGYLVGEENKGLAYMFTMMNHARLQVGLQGVALTERAYQDALNYAKERIQGNREGRAVAIAEHPDVQRMLRLMKSGKDAMRAMAYSVGVSMDLADHSEDESTRHLHQVRVDLLTPVVKGWSTELTQELVRLSVQIHGGLGFVEETGVAQYVRDAGIITIYEGTTAIQAMDLLQRKLLRDEGTAYRTLVSDIEQSLNKCRDRGEEITVLANRVTESLTCLKQAVDHVFSVADDGNRLEAIAYDFMMLFGYVTGAWYLLQSALAAQKLTSDQQRPFCRTTLNTAKFYMSFLLPRSSAHLQAVLAGSAVGTLEVDQL